MVIFDTEDKPEYAGKNVIILPELTETALEDFLKDGWVSAFMLDETKDLIRKRFKEQVLK